MSCDGCRKSRQRCDRRQGDRAVHQKDAGNSANDTTDEDEESHTEEAEDSDSAAAAQELIASLRELRESMKMKSSVLVEKGEAFLASLKKQDEAIKDFRKQCRM